MSQDKQLLNNSFQQSTFSGPWKLAEVVPIPKGGYPEVPAIKRPISLLPILSKVIEMLTEEITNCQFIKLAKRNVYISTETSLAYVTHQLLKAVVSLVVLLDM